MIDAGYILTALLGLITAQAGTIVWLVKLKDKRDDKNSVIPSLVESIVALGDTQMKLSDLSSKIDELIRRTGP